MCIEWIKKILHLTSGEPNPTTTSHSTSTPIPTYPSQPPVLPFPEEPADDTKTRENVDLEGTFNLWMDKYEVPPANYDHWRNSIVIEVYTEYPAWMLQRWPDLDPNSPALTWDGDDGKRHLAIKPEWLNAGVICHEQCHNSYALLTEDQKVAFEPVYNFVQNDPYLRLLYSKKHDIMDLLDRYGRHVEGHAEIGRYIGQFMPPELKPFYPKLFQA